MPTQSPPRTVQVFSTGGTIDKVYFDAKSTFQVGDTQIAGILRDANVTTPYHVTTLLRKDSLDLTDEDRALIVRAVEASPHEKILLTHGTDTMVTTARALLGVISKTVVLVGSLSPALFRNSDAVFNIGFAFGCVQTLPHGVYIAMNGQVFTPERVRKNRTANRFEIQS